MQPENFYGRIVKGALDDISDIPSEAVKYPALKLYKRQIFCCRCHQTTNKVVAHLPNGDFYCPQCIQFGRVTSRDLLYTIAEPNLFPVQNNALTWIGKLSFLQQKCAMKLKLYAQQKKDFLLWAVTGAGKTEIMFPAIAAAIERRERVCWAAPRIDVCNEIYPRLQRAFQRTSIILLHGAKKTDYFYSQLVVCTTHQLLKFRAAFDLLIIDEADAFPFKDNPLLQMATKNCRKENSSLLLLTATPTAEMLQQVKQRKLILGYLPLRFHGHLLPVPQIMLLPNWKKQLQQKRIASKVIKSIEKWLILDLPILVFAPEISLLDQLKTSLQQLTAVKNLATVFAADPQRIEKVQKMRTDFFQLLVTTTILERGVTFPKVNVLVIGADEQVFTQEALVQIAGRAGRSQQHPTGEVIFVCSMMNRSLKRAIKQIKFLNREGAKLHRNKLS